MHQHCQCRSKQSPYPPSFHIPQYSNTYSLLRKSPRILKTLTIYRLAFGQPRQEELVEHLLERDFSEEELENIRETLILDLCPISYHDPGADSPMIT